MEAAKEALKGGLGGIIAHSLACPIHGVAGILLKAGALGSTLATPMVTAHEYIVEHVSEPLVSLIYENPEQVHSAAHALTEYGGWGLTIAFPAYYLHKAYRVHKTHKNKHSHERI